MNVKIKLSLIDRMCAHPLTLTLSSHDYRSINSHHHHSSNCKFEFSMHLNTTGVSSLVDCYLSLRVNSPVNLRALRQTKENLSLFINIRETN
jgi:hypothetical protein